MSDVEADSLVGTKLGDKYAIEALIGEGAMGAVYRAHHLSLQRTVAIKVMHRELTQQPTFVERFQREAFSASHLDHPNSLRVLDFGQSDGRLYLVMEFAEGEDLLTVLEREWPFSDRRIVDVVSQALAALAAAHDLGIVHRDLKPENILLFRGTDDEGKPIEVVKVCDFGIAKLMGSPAQASSSFSRHLTTDGFVVGTPDYMSPEQARGEEIDGRSDLYSIGVVLYQLLVGDLPFKAETPLGIVLRHISDPPPPPSSHTKVHAHIEAVCLRALGKDPRDRFENARDMRRALRAALEESGEPAMTPAPVPASHSADMTTVPVSRPTTPVQAESRVPRVLGGVRFPVTTRGRVAALVAAAAGFAGSSLSMQYLWTHAARQAVVVATGNTVLTHPSPPISDSTVAPINGAAAGAAEQSARATAALTDREQAESDRRRTAQPVEHPTIALPAEAGRIAAGTSDGDPASSSITSPRTTFPQAPSLASAEIVAGSAPPASESPLPVAFEPATRAMGAPAQTGKPPVVADPVVPGAPTLPDPSHASVAIGVITTTGGISASRMRIALARVPLTSCYRKALANRTSAAPMEASLRISLDVSGRVAATTLSNDGNLPGLRPCIESETRSLSIRDVDTGDGSAVVVLTFFPR